MFSRKNKAPHELLSLDKNLRAILVLCQLITLISLASELTLWMNAIIGLCLLWQVAIVFETLPQPNKYLIFVIAIFGAVAIAISGKELGLLMSMVHLICFAYSIKALELHTRKDFFQLILLGIFILACAFIFHQSLWFSSFVFILLVINLSMLLMYFGKPLSFADSVKINISQVLLSIPLALVMFILFPRLEPLWQMPSAKSAKTGLGSEVRPGDIAKLALSDDLAFRVDFKGGTPPSSSMYWRAMTMPIYNGRSWQRSNNIGPQSNGRFNPRTRLLSKSQIDTSGPYYEYQVIAEASNQRWLFGLDVAQVSQREVYQLKDFSLISEKPITKTFSYNVESFFQSSLEREISSRKLEQLIELPEGSNPRLANYTKQLLALYAEPKDLIQHVLQHFAVQEYFYTLQPPRLTNNNLDEFFFESKAGFCEHYASTFAFIMRAAGIPSRLVTGYMGGEYNPQGNYYSVYQYDAHAWVEVWLEGEGWVRVDPTASVSPERISRGLSQTLADEKNALSSNFFGKWSNSRVFNQLKLQIEAIDYQWTRLVVGYSMDKQSQFLNQLFGQGKLWKVAVSFIATLVLIIGAFWLISLRKAQKTYRFAWQKEFNRVLALLSKSGFERSKEITIKSFFQIVATNISDKNGAFTCLWLSYYRLSFSELNEEALKRELVLFNRHVRECVAVIDAYNKPT